MADEQHGNGGSSSWDGDGDTPAPARRAPSDVAVTIADLALATHQTAIDLGEAAGSIDELQGAARTAALSDLEDKLGSLGDLMHEARRAVADLKG